MFELRLENENGEIVNINDEQRYQVVSCSGLNPPTASLFMSKSPNRKGSKYNGSTLDERAIVLGIKLLGDIEAARVDLYQWTDPEQYVKVYCRTEKRNVYCEGYVQECPVDIFTDNEIVNVAIVCADPYLKDLQTISTAVTALLAQFTFPFAIDNEGIPFSTMRDSNTTNVFNSGAETGCKITIECTGDVQNLVIFNASNTTQQIVLKTTLRENQTVVIDTEASPKTVRLYKPDGTVENIMKYVGGAPTWFTLKKGNNLFGYTATAGKDAAHVFVGFTNKYLGV